MPTEAHEIRLAIATLIRQSLGIGAYTIAAATGARYPRLLGLRAAAERALAATSSMTPPPWRLSSCRWPSNSAPIGTTATRFTMDTWCAGKSPWHAGTNPERQRNCWPQATHEDRLSSTRSAQTCAWPKPSCRQASGPQYLSSSSRVSRSGQWDTASFKTGQNAYAPEASQISCQPGLLGGAA